MNKIHIMQLKIYKKNFTPVNFKNIHIKKDYLGKKYYSVYKVNWFSRKKDTCVY